MTWQTVDLATYPRQAHFAQFAAMRYPYMGLTVETPVTQAVAYSRQNGCSFYLTMIHAVALAANAVPELRLRTRGKGLVQYDACGTSHIELLPDGTYAYCTLYHQQSWEDYFPYTQAARERCRQHPTLAEDDQVEGLYFVTTQPWLHYSQFIQPLPEGGQANPQFCWGKFIPDGKGGFTLPLTVLAHHGLVDGLHLSRFYQALAEVLAGI